MEMDEALRNHVRLNLMEHSSVLAWNILSWESREKKVGLPVGSSTGMCFLTLSSNDVS